MKARKTERLLNMCFIILVRVWVYGTIDGSTHTRVRSRACVCACACTYAYNMFEYVHIMFERISVRMLSPGVIISACLNNKIRTLLYCVSSR